MTITEFWSTESQGRGWCARPGVPGAAAFRRLTWAALAKDLGYEVPKDCPAGEIAIFHTETEARRVAQEWESQAG